MNAIADNVQTLNSRSADGEQLALRLDCSSSGRTVLSHRYMAYPLSVSPVFRLDETSNNRTGNRAYLYRMNTSPGLLAGDALRQSFDLGAGSQLYLADQAATKVHVMPENVIPENVMPGSVVPMCKRDSRATVDYEIKVGDRATLEFLPEPLILFADSALQQTTEITLHSAAALSWGEIILPGRLARGEAYAFRECLSRVRLRDVDGSVWFVDAMKLRGKENQFAAHPLFAEGKVLGALLLVLPEAIASAQVLATLSEEIDTLSSDAVALASSVLPQQRGGVQQRGLLVRGVGRTTRAMQGAFKQAMNAARTVRGEALLPYSV